MAGTGQTIADDADNTTFVIDILRPNERYIRLHVDRATQNATVGGAWYVQYRGKGPVAADGHGTGVQTIESFVDPVEGTA
jgi:hypothetical protein